MTPPSILFASIIYKPINFDSFFIDFRVNADNLLLVFNDKDPVLEKHIEIEYPGCKSIKNESNIGFGRACNLALDYALNRGYEYICLFNQDVLLRRDDIQKMTSHFTKVPSLMIVCPFNLNVDGRPENYFNQNLLEANGNPDAKGLQIIPFINASCWLMELDKVKICGGFNDAFFMYGEDLNYAHRLNFLGYCMAVDMHTTVIHEKQDRAYEKEWLISKKIHQSYLMAKYLNPSEPERAIRIVLTHLKYAIGDLFRFNLRSCINQVFGCIVLIRKLPELRMKRSEQLKKGAFLP